MTTARQIIRRAVKELMYLAEGEDPSAETVSDGLDMLNGMIASWHHQGLMIFYPPGKTWVGDWKNNTTYAVNDAVSRNGNTYYCTTAHVSSINDEPGPSANWGTYWTLYAETPMTLDSTLAFDASHERGIVALLAVEMSPSFNLTPSPLTMRKADEGMTALYGAFYRVPLAQIDPGITRMPSQIWPYQIPSVAS